MSRKIVFLLLIGCLAVSLASTASAATTWQRLGVNPFHQPSLRSEADLKALVRDRSADLKDGFAKAGNPELFPPFMEQFPTAKIESVKIAPGGTFAWVVFKQKRSGRVAVIKDVTWVGTAPIDAYRFTIDKDGKRHEFVVPYVCGNVALRSVTPIPPPVSVAPPAPVVAPPPAPVRPAPVAVVAPPPPPPPAPVAPKVKAVAAPVVVAAAAPPPPPPPPPPPAVRMGGPLFDVGLSRQPDPANYAFARVGYEWPLAENLYLIGLVGGAVRWMGNDGGSAFTADALLDYHWLGRLSVGAGAGYWSGNDGQVDLLADVGYLVGGSPDGSNVSLFLEARLPVDEFESPREYGRLGLGLRFRF